MRKIFLLMIHSPSDRKGGAVLIQSREPGTSLVSSTWVQSPKALSCPRLLSQTTGNELNVKRGSWDYNWHSYGILGCSGQGLWAASPCRLAHNFNLNLNICTCFTPILILTPILPLVTMVALTQSLILAHLILQVCLNLAVSQALCFS